MLDDTSSSSSSSSDLVLNLGDIVMIADYGSVKFIVCEGWYTWEGTRRNGWYFKSIADGTIIPDFEVDMDDITVVSSSDSSECSCGCGCNSSSSSGGSSSGSSSSGSSSGSNGGSTGMEYLPEDELMELLRGTFLTVDTIEERNKLSLPYPRNGKIVRVNDVKDEVKYYVWDSEKLGWQEFLFPSEASSGSSSSDTSELESQIEELESKVEALESDLGTLESTHESDVESIRTSISEMQTSITDLTSRIEAIETKWDYMESEEEEDEEEEDLD